MCAEPYGWITRPEQRFRDPPCVDGARGSIVQGDTSTELHKRVFTDIALDLHPVRLGEFVPRRGDPCLQRSVVTEHQKALRVGVEPARRPEARRVEHAGERRSARVIGELAEYAEGLVQENDRGGHG